VESALLRLCPDSKDWRGDPKTLAKRIAWAELSKSVPGTPVAVTNPGAATAREGGRRQR
jgi:hypothetical protein